MKKLMILGAGIYQVPLIKKAKEMGIFTVVTSIPGKYPGFHYADKVYYENTTDKEKVLAICQEEKVNGIVVSGTDVAIPTLGYVCDKLGLKGISYESAVLAQDKSMMKKAFVEYNVRTADVRYVDLDNSFPEAICEELGYPVIFKTIDSSGSRGITRVNGREGISYAYNQVKNNTKSQTYNIEKFLEGNEFGAQAFVYDGEIQFILPHGDYVFQGDTGVPIGHFMPYDIQGTVIEDTKDQLVKAIKAMKLDNCAINADFILADGKTYVLEIGARAGATCLPEMTGIYYGFDYYEKIIQATLGEKPDFTPSLRDFQANAAMLFISEKDGYIASIKDTSSIMKLDKHIVDISCDYDVGDLVRKFRKGPDRIGQIIAVGNTVEEAKNAIDSVMKDAIKITPPPNESVD